MLVFALPRPPVRKRKLAAIFPFICLNPDWQQENNLVATQSLRLVSPDLRILPKRHSVLDTESPMVLRPNIHSY